MKDRTILDSVIDPSPGTAAVALVVLAIIAILRIIPWLFP